MKPTEDPGGPHHFGRERQIDYQGIVDKLHANPGTWFELDEIPEDKKNAASIYTGLYRSAGKNYTPLIVTQRTGADGVSRIYACWEEN